MYWNWTAFNTILYREVSRILTIWTQTLLPPAITTLLYFIIFGNLIGSQIGDMQGLKYIEYLVPGLVLMSIITNAYSNVVFSFFSSKFQRHVEELLISPVSNHLILIGYMCSGILRGLIVGVIVTLISLLFTHFQIYNVFVTLIVFVLTAALFALGGFINAVHARSFDDINIVPTFILTPLTYLGGVFYSIDMLPPFWQSVSLLNPILYMVNAFRYGMLGISDISIGFAILIIVVCTVALYVYAFRLLEEGTGLRT